MMHDGGWFSMGGMGLTGRSPSSSRRWLPSPGSSPGGARETAASRGSEF